MSLIFIRNCQTASPSGCIVLYSPKHCRKCQAPPHLHQHFMAPLCFLWAILTVISHGGSNCISIINNDTEHILVSILPFMYPLQRNVCLYLLPVCQLDCLPNEPYLKIFFLKCFISVQWLKAFRGIFEILLGKIYMEFEHDFIVWTEEFWYTLCLANTG